MGTSVLPHAERSGEHWIVRGDAGDLRELLAALGGVASLARSTQVGPKALKELLSELRAGCLSAPTAVAQALVPAAEVVTLATGLREEGSAAVDALVTVARRSSDGVLAAIDDTTAHGLGARTRIALQDQCERATDAIAGVMSAVELIQRASVGEPVPIAVEELFEVAASITPHLSIASHAVTITPVMVTLVGASDAIFCAQPIVAAHVLIGVLARAVAILGDHALALVAEVDGDRISLRARRLEPSDDRGYMRPFVLLAPTTYNEAVLQLAAASIGAPIATHEGVYGPEVELRVVRE